MASRIRVMLVDDSAVIRGLYDRALRADSQIDIVASAGNGETAITMLKNNPADVIILDVEMPVMDGITALPELLKLSPNTRVIMSSTLTQRNAEMSLRAMELGAADYIAKPSTKEASEVNEFYANLLTKIKALAPKRLPGSEPPPSPASNYAAPSAPRPAIPVVTPPAVPVRQVSTPGPAQALAIASSTGGPQALLAVFRSFAGVRPRTPIFITQHMPANFTTILADHIAKVSGLPCHEAKDGEEVKPATIYLAPGDFHMTAKREGTKTTLHLDQNPPENFCRPSADPMLRSLAKIYGQGLLVAVLTGLGADGARGASEVVTSQGCVIAQDEATSVVYGMPKAVAEAKLTSAILPLERIAPFLIKAVT